MWGTLHVTQDLAAVKVYRSDDFTVITLCEAGGGEGKILLPAAAVQQITDALAAPAEQVSGR